MGRGREKAEGRISKVSPAGSIYLSMYETLCIQCANPLSTVPPFAFAPALSFSFCWRGRGERLIFVLSFEPSASFVIEWNQGEKREKKNSADLLENKMMIQLVARSATIHNKKLRSRNSIECRFPRSDGNSGKGRRRSCDFLHFIQPVSVFFCFCFFQNMLRHRKKEWIIIIFPRRVAVNCDWERNFVFSRRRWWWFSVAADEH